MCSRARSISWAGAAAAVIMLLGSSFQSSALAQSAGGGFPWARQGSGVDGVIVHLFGQPSPPPSLPQVLPQPSDVSAEATAENPAENPVKTPLRETLEYSGYEPECLSLLSVRGARASVPESPARGGWFKKRSGSSALPAGRTMEDRYTSVVGPGFGAFVELIETVLREGDRKTLLRMFHPRIREANKDKKFPWPIGSDRVQSTISGLWAVHTPDKSARDILCSGEDIYLSGQYGYPLQFFVWVSLSSEKDIYRVMVNVVPYDGSLYITSLHGQKWTHTGKNPLMWVQEGDRDYQNKNFMSAYLKYDLAKKLLYGASFFRLTLEDRIIENVEKYLNPQQWLARLNLIFPDHKVVWGESIFNSEGVGLSLRFALPRELSSAEFREHCRVSLRTLKAQPWFAEISSLRCSYTLPHETNPRKDGISGSIHEMKK